MKPQPTLKILYPQAAAELVASGRPTLIQFSNPECPVSALFEYAPLALHTTAPHIQVVLVYLEQAVDSADFPMARNFLFSPTYAGFERGKMIGFTHEAEEGQLLNLFTPENKYAYVEK